MCSGKRSAVSCCSRLCAAAGQPRSRPVRPRHDFGRRQGPVRRRRPRRTVTAKSLQTQELATAVTDASGYFTMTTLRPGSYDVSAELRGLQEGEPHGRARSTRAPPSGWSSSWRRAASRKRSRSRPRPHRCRPTSRSGRRSRRRTSSCCPSAAATRSACRPEAGRASAATSTTPASQPQQRRLQHQRQPLRREQHHDRRRDGHPHAVGGRDHRRAERRRDPGSPGADGQLHAGVRAAPAAGRSASSPRAAATATSAARRSSTATTSCRPTRGRATAAPTPIENSGPAPFDYKQYGCSFGGPIPGRVVKNKLFFFGAQEWVNYFAVATNTAAVPTAAMRNGDFSELLGTNPFYSGAAGHQRPAHRPAVPGQRHPGEPAVAERHGAPEAVPDADARVPAGLGQRSSSTATTRRTSGRTTSGSTTGWATTTRSPSATRSYNWTAIDAFRGTFPFARTDWDRPNKTKT